MVLGWRRAFCTSVPRDEEKTEFTNPSSSTQTTKITSKKFTTFFSSSSNPSTPRFQSQPVSTPSTSSLSCKTIAISPTTAQPGIDTPKLHCKINKNNNNNSPRFFNFSNPSSPRSPSTFSFLKSSRLRFSKSRCGICFQNVKTGQGTAIFTAECSHSFHFPCVASHVRKQGALNCPVCSFTWKEMPVLSIHNVNSTEKMVEKLPPSPKTIHVDTNNNTINSNLALKVYNDDEPLKSITASGARWFNPIPESDEENETENGEFQGFFTSVNSNTSRNAIVEMKLLPEVAMVSSGRVSETRVVVLKVKAPTAKVARRAPIDLVTVIDVSANITSDKLHMMKKAMRLVVSSLSAADRLSIVAFSTASKRLLPLRRMTTAGRRSARRMVDAIVTLDGSSASATHALKKAVKVLEDRREKNPATSILLISDSHGDRFSGNNNQKRQPFVCSTRFSHLEIPVHSIALNQLNAYEHASLEDIFSKSIGDLLSVVVQDFTVKLGCISGSAPADIAAVYSYVGRPTALGSGLIRLGELYADEERELLIELKVASSAIGAHHVLSVRSSYKDPSSQELVNCREQALLVPRPHDVKSSTSSIHRLKDLFVTTRAVAEARRLIERKDLSGAETMLGSARALLLQSGSSDEFVRALEGELSELNSKKQNQVQRRVNVERDSVAYVDDKTEPLTPTSAWRAAERLAKLAVVRKSLNRVSDLHGFENARF